MNALTSQEQSRLNQLEAIISTGMETFVEVATAITEIHKSRLYRATHKTFDEYCYDRWQWSRQRAHQLMNAGKMSTLVDNLSNEMKDTPKFTVDNERTARALSPLASKPPEEIKEVLKTIVQEYGTTPTAAEVRSTVQSYYKPPVKMPSKTGPMTIVISAKYFVKYKSSGAQVDSVITRDYPLNQQEVDAIRYSKTDTHKGRLINSFLYNRMQERESFFDE